MIAKQNSSVSPAMLMDEPIKVEQYFNGVPAFKAMEKYTSSEVKNPHPQTLRSSLRALAGFDEFKKKTRNLQA